jgi:hypothetical protein
MLACECQRIIVLTKVGCGGCGMGWGPDNEVCGQRRRRTNDCDMIDAVLRKDGHRDLEMLQ